MEPWNVGRVCFLVHVEHEVAGKLIMVLKVVLNDELSDFLKQTCALVHGKQ